MPIHDLKSDHGDRPPFLPSRRVQAASMACYSCDLVMRQCGQYLL
jgi:hypothetical protein